MIEYNGYNIVAMGTFAMYQIKNQGSGPVAKPLQGSFTSKDLAKQAIDAHVASSKKGKTDGASKDGSTG